MLSGQNNLYIQSSAWVKS